MPEKTQIPRVLWAQQREHVLLTIAVPDIEKVNVQFGEDSVEFQGQTKATNPKDQIVYAVKIDLFDKIDGETSKYENIGQKYWRLLLTKKDSMTSFWPRLTKDKARLHWLQTDFDHWKDEDESDDEKGGFNGNFQNMFGGGVGDMPEMPDMEGDDSDDEEADGENEPPAESSPIETDEKGEKVDESSVKVGEQEQSN